MTGGAGADIYVYAAVVGSGPPAGNNDIVTDFNHSQSDRIDLRGNGINSIDDLSTGGRSVTQSGLDTLIDLGTLNGTTNLLTLQNVTAASLQTSDFIFEGQIAVTVETPAGYDFSTLYDDIADGDPAQPQNDSTHIFVVVDRGGGTGLTFELIGSGFTFDVETHAPTGAGTITAINILDTIDLSDPTLTAQDHILVSTNGWNIGVGDLFDAIFDFNDEGQSPDGLNAIFNTPSYSIVGSAGSQFFDGAPLDGADTFVSSNSADVFNGLPGPFGPFDAGRDTVSYMNASNQPDTSFGVTADLANSSFNEGLAAVGDIYISIENLRGSDFDDFLFGDANANVLEGGFGNDELDGGIGGSDTASYEHSEFGVSVDLTISGFQNTGIGQEGLGAGSDTLVSIENLRGSSHNDILIGNGNAMLEGGAGEDELIGSLPEEGQDGDTASYEHAQSAVTADLGNSANNTGDAFGDTYTDIRNLFGSRFTDHLTGDGNNNIISGGFGSSDGGGDVLTGGGGADTFVFSGGPITINDFSSGESDKVDLVGQSGMTESQLQALIDASTGNSIDFGGFGEVTFANIANVSTSLTTNDFLLNDGS